MEHETTSDGPARAARQKAGEGLEHAGGALHRAARKAEAKGGATARVSPAADRLGGSLEDAADYIRGTELEEMRRDLETTVRQNPLRSLLVAAVAGYFVGKILR